MELNTDELKKSVESLKENLFQAKSIYEKIRIFITLGNTYVLLSDYEDERTNLVNALLSFDEAFKIVEPVQNKRDLAEIEMQKGYIFYKLSFLEDRNYNLEKAIQHFKSSLGYLGEEEEVSKVVRVKYNLANAYLAVRGEKIKENIEKGIEELKSTLKILEGQNDRKSEGLVKSALGVGYLIYAKTRRDNGTDELKLSKEYFNEAKRYFEEESEKFDYAACENGFGSASLELALIGVEQDKNFEEAIDHFGQALQFYSIEQTPLDYASAQYNLGVTYFNYAKSSETDKEDKLINAIYYFEKALEVFTEDLSRDEYGRINYQVGIVYRELFIIKREKDILENEIEKFKNTLRVIDEKGNPFTFITTHFFLGEAYYFLEDIKTALNHYDEALRIAEKNDENLAKQIREIEEIVKRNG